MFGIFARWRRRRLARRPLPQSWLPYLDEHVPFYRAFDAERRQRFLELLKVFVWEKHFFGAGGLELTDEHRVVIAASAVRLVLDLDLSYYDRLTEIIVYPRHYTDADEGETRLGEAHAWGTVVLSWNAVLTGLNNQRDGHDVALHEFAHVLDRADGAFDGTPELRRSDHYGAWAEVLSEHFLKLRDGKRTQRRVLDTYGAQNEAEFFAVATEAFFEKPKQLQKLTPDLYEELRRFFRGGDAADDD